MRVASEGIATEGRPRQLEVTVAEGRIVRIAFPPAERCYGAGGEDGNFVALHQSMERPVAQPNDLSRSLVPLDQDSTISFEDPGPPMGEGVSS